jgi:hypothetical protein
MLERTQCGQQQGENRRESSGRRFTLTIRRRRCSSIRTSLAFRRRPSSHRGTTLSRLRALIKQADPEVVEEWKWSVPAWSHDGLICTGEAYKSVVELTFAKGAALKDPSGLFNSSLEGNTRRAIDFHQGDEINENAFKTLIRAAAALNRASGR